MATSVRPGWKKYLSYGVRLALTGLMIWVSFQGARSIYYARHAYSAALELRGLVDNSVHTQATATDIRALQQALIRLEEPLEQLHNEVGRAAPLLQRLQHAPRYGATLANLPELIWISLEYTQIAQDALNLTAQVQSPNNGASFSEFIENAAKQPEPFQALAHRSAAVEARLHALPVLQFAPTVAGKLHQAQEVAPLLTAGLELMPHLATLLGFEEERTYLLLMQNNHELRATGGFVTAVGLLTLKNGEVKALAFKDSYEVDNPAVKHPWAPEPMQRYLDIDLMFLRDVNWSPDFPTTAQLARSLYAQNEGVWVDGVVALDLHAVQYLVESMGTLHAPGIQEPITGANVVAQMKEFWRNAPLIDVAPNQASSAEEPTATDWWGRRKDFMPLLAEAMRTRLESGAIDHARVAWVLVRAFNQRSVQLWMNTGATAQALSRLAWDGALQPTAGADFLALVDSNLGYNKADSAVERTLRYAVQWPNGSNAPALARATIAYTHAVNLPDHRCDLSPRYGDSYDDMIARCYFDYVRLYAPGGSRLVDVEGVERASVSSTRGEQNTQLFAAYMVLMPGERREISFIYELPLSIQLPTYELMVQRQAGTEALPVEIEVAGYGAGAVLKDTLLRWSPAP